MVRARENCNLIFSLCAPAGRSGRTVMKVSLCVHQWESGNSAFLLRPFALF